MLAAVAPAAWGQSVPGADFDNERCSRRGSTSWGHGAGRSGRTRRLHHSLLRIRNPAVMDGLRLALTWHNIADWPWARRVGGSSPPSAGRVDQPAGVRARPLLRVRHLRDEWPLPHHDGTAVEPLARPALEIPMVRPMETGAGPNPSICWNGLPPVLTELPDSSMGGRRRRNLPRFAAASTSRESVRAAAYSRRPSRGKQQVVGAHCPDSTRRLICALRPPQRVGDARRTAGASAGS